LRGRGSAAVKAMGNAGNYAEIIDAIATNPG